MIEEGMPVAPRDQPVSTTPEMDYLTGVFWDLHLSRQAGLGPNPILYSEIEAWQRLQGKRLSVWWLYWLKILDALFLKASSAAAAK